MPTPEIPRFEERKSSREDYDLEFKVDVGSDVFSASYTFYYRLERDIIKVLGKSSGGSSKIVMDDETFSSRIAIKGSQALDLALGHLRQLYPDVSEINVEPKVLRVGGLFVAWNLEKAKEPST